MVALEAVLEIGSTGIRLMACEITGLGTWTVIDRSEMPVPIGSDVFTTGYVSKETILQCIKILKRYKEQLNGWAIEENHIQVIATSALREARNRDTVLDRILVKTGFRVKVIDGIEENRLMYIAVLDTLKESLPTLREHSSVIIEIGGGSTELMLMDHGKMAAVHSLRLGTVIIEQNQQTALRTQKDAHRFLEEFIRNTGVNLSTELKLERIKTFITMGSEILLAAHSCGTKLSDRIFSITRENFFSFVSEVQDYTPEECMARFKISYNDAKLFGVGLLTYKLFLNLTSAEEIIVTDTSIRDGIILSRISAPNAQLQQEFFSQIVASARNLGKRYFFDEAHANHVRYTALTLFDAMHKELGVSDHGRLLLEIAALLHDVGTYIRAGDHELHSEYIISHSDIFGLNKDDMNIISQVAKYHRGSKSLYGEAAFSALPRNDRVLVLKLSAILRVADALDRSHSQKIKELIPELRGDNMILRVEGTQDTNLERIALEEKGDLFESVFGYKLLLN